MSDPLQTLVQLARLQGLTPPDLHRAAELLALGTATLADVLADLERAHAGPAISYPEAYRYLRNGRPGVGAAPAVSGFDERPYTDLTKPAVASGARGIQVIVAEGRRLDGRERAVADARAQGAAAAEHYIRTARAISRALVEAGWFATDPLAGLSPPRRPGGGREKSLTDQELCDYLTAVLTASSDPLRDALAWCLIRVGALRQIEARGVAVNTLSPDRPSVLVVGKRGRPREMPVARPLVEAILACSAERPGDPRRHALRGPRGGPLSGGRFDAWSDSLHAQIPWSRGHDIGVHALRHSTAREVARRCGENSVPAALFLGHRPEHDLATIAVYLHSDYSDEWSLRRLIAERTFGPLTAWPDLPENEVLRLFLPGPWSP